MCGEAFKYRLTLVHLCFPFVLFSIFVTIPTRAQNDTLLLARQQLTVGISDECSTQRSTDDQQLAALPTGPLVVGGSLDHHYEVTRMVTPLKTDTAAAGLETSRLGRSLCSTDWW